jgi:hypothetical protein
MLEVVISDLNWCEKTRYARPRIPTLGYTNAGGGHVCCPVLYLHSEKQPWANSYKDYIALWQWFYYNSYMIPRHYTRALNKLLKIASVSKSLYCPRGSRSITVEPSVHYWHALGDRITEPLWHLCQCRLSSHYASYFVSRCMIFPMCIRRELSQLLLILADRSRWK